MSPSLLNGTYSQALSDSIQQSLSVTHPGDPAKPQTKQICMSLIRYPSGRPSSPSSDKGRAGEEFYHISYPNGHRYISRLSHSRIKNYVAIAIKATRKKNKATACSQPQLMQHIPLVKIGHDPLFQ